MKAINPSAPSPAKNAWAQPDDEPIATANPQQAQRPTSQPRDPEFTIYKPNAKGSGAAMRLSLSLSKAAIFTDAAPQNGERQFFWEEKITMKWNLSDIGSLLATLEKYQPEAKLFHQSEKASSTCHLIASDNPERAPFMITLTRQATADRSLRKVTLPITHGEASILRSLLTDACRKIAGW